MRILTCLAAEALAREFRGVWITTVSNIDWPKQRGLSPEVAQAQLIAQLDLAQENNFNVVVFQIRPQADAFYRSELEPWSYWLTNKQGVDPGWDPLEFAITEAHRRGLELHGWLNPYRANAAESQKDNLDPLSPVHQYPDYAYEIGKYIWLDPGADEIKAHTKAVISDILNRYDVDGLHYDDYFYPYPSYNNYQGFPDDATYAKYVNAGGAMSREDWRRENVNELIRDTYELVKNHNSYVNFGVAPFGIWRPGNPPGIVGMDAYKDLYCDSKKWLNEGWLDYLAPQLYWPIDSSGQPFEDLYDWWNEQNYEKKHVMTGLYASGVMEHVKDWPAQEIVDQIELMRNKQLSTGVGEIHFSMQAFEKNTKGLTDLLKSTVYANKSNVPALPWRFSGYPPIPSEPQLRINDWTIEIEPGWDHRSYGLYENDLLVDVIGNAGEGTIVYKVPKELQNKNLCFKSMNKDRLESGCTKVCHLGIVVNDFWTCGDLKCNFDLNNARVCMDGIDDEYLCHAVGCLHCPANQYGYRCLWENQ
ncbi:Oidioi.mRNA.OKI2018_I69.chr1.g1432.t1.cds [Oikopleura dioica]|uniref:Oidioi.mRNA.OKI2018_I69.chr1.g1432.t1.cds n=1 Tax=Oikopleura dioica TaxID=34765 RepID=A0ABN7SMW6_OIKDI|nr:Oidioi.mRNA.OKI2018_I69.chr1.g1432.t1.cds [Oikopleura dioica]